MENFIALLSGAQIVPQGISDPVRARLAEDRLTMIIDALSDAYDLVLFECGPADIASLKRLVRADGTEIILSVPGLSEDAIAGLVVGVIILDFGIQSALVSNQHLIYALDPAARSRLNTIFMIGMFLGGAIGSAVATFAWRQGGWTGVSLLGGGLAIIALAVLVINRGETARH